MVIIYTMKYTKLLFVACFFLVLHSVLGTQIANSTGVRLSWYTFDAIEDLAWSGQNVVFMLTESYEIYRSVDEGQTWTAQFQNSTYSVAQMHQDPLDDKKFIFMTDGLSAGWTTTDAGQTYSFVSFGASMGEVHFNPNISGLLLTAHCSSYCNYYVSTDFARSFTLIGTGWYDARWGELAKGGSPTTVYAVDSSFNFGYTVDYGRSFHVIFKLCFGFLFTQNHLFIAVVAPDNMLDVILMVSTEANTVASSYKEAQFPFGDDLPQNAYTFLDDSTGGEWMGVSNTNNWGTVYTSDSTGVKYTTSLKHVFHRNYLFDFAIFYGLEGIYIANNVTNFDQSGAAVKTTIITFDNGGVWRNLIPPKVDSLNQPISCTGKCSLHLHGINDWITTGMGPFYSSANAIGLLIATGNVGENLVTDKNQVNLYLSRDAGLTWSELMKGPYIYEFGDHGGIIVFADTSGYTSELKYSLDEGLSIQTVPLDQQVDVTNIRVEPSATSHKFILYGEDTLGKAVLIGVDFAGVQSRICVDSDYEPWSPTDGRASGLTCQLGRNVTYLRRKRDANCFNNRDTEHVLSVINCACVVEDYECDFGFEETLVNGQPFCALSSVNPPADPPSYCPPGTTYEISSGHRRVAGDSCVGDLTEYQSTTKQCPDAIITPTGTNKTLIVVVVIFVVLAVIGISGFFVYRNEVWREKFLSVVGKVIPINQGPSYSRLGRGALANDEEFGIGGEQDHDSDDDVEEDAPELQDHDIQRATSDKRDEFNPRT
jgi:hypothetical protein